MASIAKLLCVVLVIISLVIGGNCQCTTNDIKIEQSKTESTVQNKQEWSVTVKNDCACTQLDVKLDCKGYQTVEPVDASVLSFSSDTGLCSVNNGQPIYGFKSLTFKYAWDSYFSFTPVSSQLACS